jgi:hypothetical protein
MKVNIGASLICKGKVIESQFLGRMISQDNKISLRYFKKLKNKCTLKLFNNAYIKFYANEQEIIEIPLYNYCILTKGETK